MIPTTPSGTRTWRIRRPLGRTQPAATSPTGSGSGATVRRPPAIASTRAGVSRRRSMTVAAGARRLGAGHVDLVLASSTSSVRSTSRSAAARRAASLAAVDARASARDGRAGPPAQRVQVGGLSSRLVHPNERNGPGRVPPRPDPTHLRSRRCSPSASPPCWWRLRWWPARCGCARAVTTASSSDGPTTTVAASTTAPADPTTLTCIPELEDACRSAAAEHGPRRHGRGGRHHHRPPAPRPSRPAPSPGSRSLPCPRSSTSSAARRPGARSSPPRRRSRPRRSPLVGRQDQMAVLAAHCGGDDHVALPRRRRRPAVDRDRRPGGVGRDQARPRRRRHQRHRPAHVRLRCHRAGSAARDVSTLDLDDDAFSAWVRRLERSIPYFGGPQGTPFEQFLLAALDQRRRHDRGRGRRPRRCPPRPVDRHLPWGHGTGRCGARHLGPGVDLPGARRTCWPAPHQGRRRPGLERPGRTDAAPATVRARPPPGPPPATGPR